MNGIGELKSWASARVMSTGVVTFQRGCRAVRNGIGDVTIFLDKQCDKYEGLYGITSEQSDTKFAVTPGDGQLGISIKNTAGDLVDRTFEFYMFKLGNQNSPDSIPGPQ